MIGPERYCEECGCEILCDEDVGLEEIRRDVRCRVPGHPEHGLEIFENPFRVCRTCTEETERWWEAFMKTPEFEIECAFLRWVRGLSGEAKHATI
jgi:hypothetical protein